jgi:putative ABC transport system substrate-binding protein
MIGVDHQDILADAGIQNALDRGISKMARSYNESTLQQLKTVLSEKLSQPSGTSLNELTDAVDGVYSFADERRADLIAKTESYRAANYANKAAWKASGVVKTVVWYTAAISRHPSRFWRTSQPFISRHDIVGCDFIRGRQMAVGIGRRAFVTGLGGAAAALPLGARAQQAAKIFRIGFFGPALRRPSSMVPLYQAFLAQLHTLGFAEGQNLNVTYGEVEDPSGLTAVVTELMRAQPELIVVSGTETMLQAVLASKPNIPIVLIAVNFDPIARGYIASLAKPGGNITGVVFQQLELVQKQVELLTQAFPGKTQLAALYDAQTADQFSAAERSARTLNLQIQGQKFDRLPYDFKDTFQKVAAGGAEMVLVQSSPLFIPHQAEIGKLGKAYRLPTMFLFKAYVDDGGLMSYGVDFPPMYRRAAEYVVKILKGTQPADLPVEQPTKFELAINLKTAKALGVTLPVSLIATADDVIE